MICQLRWCNTDLELKRIRVDYVSFLEKQQNRRAVGENFETGEQPWKSGVLAGLMITKLSAPYGGPLHHHHHHHHHHQWVQRAASSKVNSEPSSCAFSKDLVPLLLLLLCCPKAPRFSPCIELWDRFYLQQTQKSSINSLGCITTVHSILSAMPGWNIPTLTE